MDFEKDYILRLIQMLGDLMRRLLDDQQRDRMLNDVCREWCGMGLEAGERLAPEALCDLLAPEPRLVMAELLADKADAITLPAYTADDLRLRALRLLASLHAHGANVGVGFRAEGSFAGAENLAPGVELHMGFQTDDHFPAHALSPPLRRCSYGRRPALGLASFS